MAVRLIDLLSQQQFVPSDTLGNRFHIETR